MKRPDRSDGFGNLYKLALALAFSFIAIIPMGAQNGDPGVWLSSGKEASGAYIDASAFCTSGCSTSQDFCKIVNEALHALPASGGVVDARGINSGGSNTCTNTTPYYFSGGYTITSPSTLLLPAGTISANKTWILPNASKVIGVGSGASGYGVTTLVAPSTGSGWMIQMGPNNSSSTLTPCTSAPLGHCTEIAVEDLTLQGGASINGIVNGQAQDMSYVKRVNMYQIGGIGLEVWQGDTNNSAQNSGPYSDIVFDAGSAGSSSTVCAEILDIPTRGIHGLTCKTESGSPAFAVQIASPNNSVQDAHISGSFTEGIQVTSAASNVLLFNVTGSEGVTYLIDLLSGNTSPNISIMGASSGGSTDTLFDQITSTTLNDSYLAMYVLGESGAGGNGYSRFTTSLNSEVVTWGQGSGSLPSTCNKGDLFSNTSGTGNLYVCTTANTWSAL
jgi:hypothetical protein